MIQECNLMVVLAVNLIVGGDCLFVQWTALQYVFSDYIMKMLAKGTAIFVPMAAPYVCW